MSARVISSSAANGSSISRIGLPKRERPHERDALLHAARELVGAGVQEVAEADLAEQVDVVGRAWRSGWPGD